MILTASEAILRQQCILLACAGHVKVGEYGLLPTLDLSWIKGAALQLGCHCISTSVDPCFLAGHHATMPRLAALGNHQRAML